MMTLKSSISVLAGNYNKFEGPWRSASRQGLASMLPVRSGAIQRPMMEPIRRMKHAVRAVLAEIGEGISRMREGGGTNAFCDPIDIQHADNQDLISFLKANNNKIVLLDTYIDVHVADSKHIKAIGQAHAGSDAEPFSSFSALSLPLSYSQGTCVTALFNFYENCMLKYSSEKDLFRFEIKGYFQIGCAVHGWTAVFQLTEVKAKEDAAGTY